MQSFLRCGFRNERILDPLEAPVFQGFKDILNMFLFFLKLQMSWWSQRTVKSYWPFSSLPSYSKPQQTFSKFKILKHRELQTSLADTDRSQTWPTLSLLGARTLLHHESSSFLSLLSRLVELSLTCYQDPSTIQNCYPRGHVFQFVLMITFEKPWRLQTFVLILLNLSQLLKNLFLDVCLWLYHRNYQHELCDAWIKKQRALTF